MKHTHLTIPEIRVLYPHHFPSERERSENPNAAAEREELLKGMEIVRGILGMSADDFYGVNGAMATTSRLLQQELEEGDEVCPSWLLKERLRSPPRRGISHEDPTFRSDCDREKAWDRAVVAWKRNHRNTGIKPTIGELLRLAQELWEE